MFNSLTRNGSETRESTALDKNKYKKSLCVSETAVENQVASWIVQIATHIISPSRELISLISFNPVMLTDLLHHISALCCHVLRLYSE